MAHLSLALLGPFQATLAGQPAALTAPRLQALLAYLAVESGREHSREALAGLFWPERPDREAMSALRFALSNLRRAIESPTPSRLACLLPVTPSNLIAPAITGSMLMILQRPRPKRRRLSSSAPPSPCTGANFWPA